MINTLSVRQNPPVSVVRLYLLRACYLLLVVGLGLTKWPLILSGAASQPLHSGAVNALLAALGLLSIAGLFAPLRMLPLLVFEVTWKLIWVVSVALPLWMAHALTDAAGAFLFAVCFAIPFLFIIPWRYVFDHYVKSPEPWV